MRYLLYLPINFLFMLVCMIFNPIVVLFTKDDGNLPDCLRWFQTHDQVLFFEEDYIAEKWPELVNIKPAFLKLYLCRVWWLYRNAGYDFAYEVCGYEYDKENLVNKSTDKYEFLYDASKSLWSRGWKFFMYYPYPFYPQYGLRIYVGWKMDKNESKRAMLAMHLNPWRNCP